jgi:hypothetical protein
MSLKPPNIEELSACEKISRGLAEKNILLRSELIRFGIFPLMIFLILLMVWLIIIAFKLL